jgi:PrtD family type I secretion system ABC transporter
MSRALAPVEQAIGTWKSAIAARGAYHRVRRQLIEAPAKKDRITLPAPTGRIGVGGVTFYHPGQAEPTLHNVSFSLEPGEVLGLIGPTASGKSTLAELLVGTLTPRVGHVRLDGADVTNWASEDRGQYVGYLPQDIELFSGTVRENISRMGEAEAESVIAAAMLAGVHDMILRMPEGYETQIGEGGAALSGGQRQRIALARAVFGSPRFVVLDEPNASLDAAGEQALLDAIQTLKAREVTLVVIAHRPSVLHHVDKILILKGGRVANFGAAAEVMPQLTGLKTVETAASGEGRNV